MDERKTCDDVGDDTLTIEQSLSHPLIAAHLAEIEADPKAFAPQFDHALREKGRDSTIDNWQFAELLYYIKRFKTWQYLTYTDYDENGDQQQVPFDNFKQYMDLTPYLPFKAGWGYRLVECYEKYRLDLNIGRDTPDVLALMMEMGSFEKLRILKPVIDTVQDAEYWFEKAIPMTVDDLDIAVNAAQVAPDTSPAIITMESQRRIWKSSPEPMQDLKRRTLKKLIPGIENIPDTAVVEITARVIEWGSEND